MLDVSGIAVIMLKQLSVALILTLAFASGCAKRESDSLVDTVHGYLRCNKDIQEFHSAMREIAREYGFKHMHGEGQSTDTIEYTTTSYLLPGNQELVIETIAEKGQPIHIRFKMEPKGLYSQEEIMTELARRISLASKARPLEVKEPLENN